MNKFKIMTSGLKKLEMITKVRIILLDTIFSIQSLRTNQKLMKFQDFWSKARGQMNQSMRDFTSKSSWQERLLRRQNKQMSAQGQELAARSLDQNLDPNLLWKRPLKFQAQPLGQHFVQSYRLLTIFKTQVLVFTKKVFKWIMKKQNLLSSNADSSKSKSCRVTAHFNQSWWPKIISQSPPMHLKWPWMSLGRTLREIQEFQPLQLKSL